MYLCPPAPLTPDADMLSKYPFSYEEFASGYSICLFFVTIHCLTSNIKVNMRNPLTIGILDFLESLGTSLESIMVA